MPATIHFLTWTTYGTWLPGDERGWASAKTHSAMQPQGPLDTFSAKNLRAAPMYLDEEQRAACANSIEATCQYYGWELCVVNVRQAHVHALVGADVPSWRIMQAAKAWATRKMREAGLTKQNRPVWTSNGSTRIVVDSDDLRAVLAHVLEGQGEVAPGTVRGSLVAVANPDTLVSGVDQVRAVCLYPDTHVSGSNSSDRTT